MDEALEKYISNNSYDLHPIQKKIIEDNNKLGNLNIMQISETQCKYPIYNGHLSNKQVWDCLPIAADYPSSALCTFSVARRGVCRLRLIDG